MKTHRFIGDFDLAQATLELHDRALIHQMARVLQLREGERVVLCDGKGNEADARIAESGASAIVVGLGRMRRNAAEPKRKTVVYCAVLKRENFELVVQKTTEVGVAKIVPILTARTIKTGVKLDRLRLIAKEAAEQSGRGIVPEVHPPMAFVDAVRQAREHGANAFLDVSGGELRMAADALSAGLFIGPEGGWDAEEIALAASAHFDIAGLGPLTLRAETAAIVGAYLSLHR